MSSSSAFLQLFTNVEHFQKSVEKALTESSAKPAANGPASAKIKVVEKFMLCLFYSTFLTQNFFSFLLGVSDIFRTVIDFVAFVSFFLIS